MAILKTSTQCWRSVRDTQRSAQALARQLKPAGALLQLHGPLGAGKTTFTRFLLQALGVSGPVKSPTYGLMEQYDLPQQRISHFDFYRFNDPAEFEDAGFRDIFAEPGLKLVEWPDKAAGLLPTADLNLTISPDDAGLARQACFEALTPVGLELLP